MNTLVNAYRDAYRRAQEDPEGFWSERAAALHWERRWDRVLDASRAPFYRWFPGGRISTCYNALDRHVEQGRGEQAALIYDSPVTGTVAQLTYRELRERVARFAPIRSPRRRRCPSRAPERASWVAQQQGRPLMQFDPRSRAIYPDM